jgi:hypothetical protein
VQAVLVLIWNVVSANDFALLRVAAGLLGL